MWPSTLSYSPTSYPEKKSLRKDSLSTYQKREGVRSKKVNRQRKWYKAAKEETEKITENKPDIVDKRAMVSSVRKPFGRHKNTEKQTAAFDEQKLKLLIRNTSKAKSTSTSAPSPYSTEKEKGKELSSGSAAPVGQHSQEDHNQVTDSTETDGQKMTIQEDRYEVSGLAVDPDFKVKQDVAEGSHPSMTEKDENTSSKVDNNAAPDMFDKFENVPDDYLKRCLSYCYLFPRGYEFEREKLVQLWIAEDLIEGEGTGRIEDKANEYFKSLADTEYFVPSQGDKAYGQLEYKMNESKFSKMYLDEGPSPGEFVRINASGWSDLSEKTLHLSLSHDEKFVPRIFKALQKCKKLRTLLLLGHFGYSVNQVPEDLFLSLRSLRTLDLSQTKISKLPSTVGELELLQYLDLSYTIIKELPEVLCCLRKLQTLKLRDCFDLFALPKYMRELTNLRHLDFDIVRQLSSMPKEMRKLKHLQTLPGFIVGIDDGCGIQELSDLKNITGSFCISKLENVSSAEEAKRAVLKNKEYLTKLELRWEECKNAEIEEQILEYLEPHSGLQELEIQFYSGSVLPSWISNQSFSITMLTLYHCANCHSLPFIGDLPRLKSLTIVAMYKVRKINRLFGNNDENSTNSQQNCAFPKLEKLMLDDMLDLEKWTGVKTGDFPRLVDVCIKYCPKLRKLPSRSRLRSLKYMEVSNCSELQSFPGGCLPASLESLTIRDCPKLTERYFKGGKYSKKIAHVPRILIDDDGDSSSH